MIAKEGINVNNNMFPDAMAAQIGNCGVIAVLIIDRAEDAVPVARALMEGGVSAMELTLRTPAAMDALRAVAENLPEMLAGAGTVITPAQVKEVFEAGADFAVSAGMNRRVVEEAGRLGLPFAPGVATPSDIEQALEFGCRLLKFFPAEAGGGLAYLKSMAAPYAHLGLKFIPLGGLDAGNMKAYLQEPIVQCIGGSWLAPRELIRQRRWDAIRRNAAAAAAIVRELKEAAS